MTDYERTAEYPEPQRNLLTTALTFLFVGLGVGALTALLLAPKTGRQLRRDLRRRYEDARDTVGDWSDQAGDWVDRGSEWANVAKEKVAPLRKSLRVK